MHAYAIQDSRGLIKLDAMENPFRLPPDLQQELGERLGRVAINRYPVQSTADVVAALSKFVDLPTGCKLILGNGSDELIDILSVACDSARCHAAGAAAGLRDVPDVGAAARAELRRCAADGGL
jgi:histidinol-phosphate aminotransferase